MRGTSSTRALLAALAVLGAACGGDAVEATDEPDAGGGGTAATAAWLPETGDLGEDADERRAVAADAEAVLAGALLEAIGLGDDDRAASGLAAAAGALVGPEPVATAEADAPVQGIRGKSARPAPSPAPAAAAAAADLAADGASLGVGLLPRVVGLALAEQRRAGGDIDVAPADGTHTRVAEGRLDARYQERRSAPGAGEGGGATTDVDLALEVDTAVCPDPEGHLAGTLRADVTLTVTDGGTTRSGRYQLEVDYVLEVGDDAHLAAMEIDTLGSTAGTTTGTAPDGRPQETEVFIEAGVGFRRTGSLTDRGATLSDARGPGITRASSGATAEAQAAFGRAQVSLGLMVTSFVADELQTHWRSGACVEARLTPDAGPSGLEPGQTVTVTGEGVSTVDGRPVGGTAVAELVAGGASLAGADGPTDAPVTLTYRAPDEGSGEVSLEVTSRRGIGRTTMTFDVGGGWAVDTTVAPYRFTGAKCGGFGGRWELDATATVDGATFTGTLVADIDPATLTGSFTLTGAFTGGGFAIEQRATGTARVDVEAATLAVHTTESVMTHPDGSTRTDTGSTAVLPLTPATSCG